MFQYHCGSWNCRGDYLIEISQSYGKPLLCYSILDEPIDYRFAYFALLYLKVA